MCVHISADVILANLLSNEEAGENGVTPRDIDMYCDRVIFALHGAGKSHVCFAAHHSDLQDAVARYPHYFRKFRDRFFRVDDNVDIDTFNKRYPTDIDKILSNAAHNTDTAVR